MTMEPQNTIINFPKKSYEVKISYLSDKPSIFKIEPLSKKCEQLITQIFNAGAHVTISPEVNPTCIFFNYYNDIKPQHESGHDIVGINLKMNMHLLDDSSTFFERLQNFLSAIDNAKNNQFPSKYEEVDVMCVRVIKDYKF